MKKEELRASIMAWLRLLHDDGDVVELRAPGDRTLSGYYKVGRDDEEIANTVLSYESLTIYQTMQHVNDALLSRSQSAHFMQVGKKMKTTSDGDISSLRWILVDVDPTRPADTSASDAEKAEALKVIKRIYAALKASGFKEPVIGDSGNGYHLLYRIDLPTEASEMVHEFLQVLDMNFSTDAAKVDLTVFNPARITKLYGTVAVKGANTEERPWRRSCIKYAPEVIEVNEGMLIKRIADELPTPEQNKYFKHQTSEFDVRKFLAEKGVEVEREVAYGSGTKLVLKECPFNPEHKAPDSAVFIMNSGALGFKCLHNGCAGRTWHDVREALDPDAYYEGRSDKVKYISHPREAEWYEGRKKLKDEKLNEQNDGGAFFDIADIEPIDQSKVIKVKSGIRKLDIDLGGGFNMGELSIWTGRNGSGKSVLLEQMALDAIDQGYKVLIYSGELKKETLKDWIYRQAAGIEGVTQPKGDDVEYWEVLPERYKQIDDALRGKLFVYNNEMSNTAEQVQTSIAAAVDKYEAKVIILDNLMSLDFDIGNNNDLWQTQSKLIKDMKRLAETKNCHVHFICHPRKGARKELLTRYDISGSGDITNAADNVLFIYRVDEEFKGAFEATYKLENKQQQATMTNEQATILNADNVVHITKNRDRGKSDIWYPLNYCKANKTMSDHPGGIKQYSWQTLLTGEQLEEIDISEENPFADL